MVAWPVTILAFTASTAFDAVTSWPHTTFALAAR